MAQRVVIKAHKASYDDPIAVRKGDVLNLTGQRDLWDGHIWLWAIGPDGREGWVPDDLPDPKYRAARDFDAQELSCQKGDRVEAASALNGWVWCIATSGAAGWVPERNFAAHEADQG